MRNQRMSTWNSGYYPTTFYGTGRKSRSMRRKRSRTVIFTVGFLLLAASAVALGLNALMTATETAHRKTVSSIQAYTEMPLAETGPLDTAAALTYASGDLAAPVSNTPDAYASMAANTEGNPSIEVSNAIPAQDDSWMLMLVNRWNPLPEGYTVQLMDVPGGVQVDERIYQPLMEMLDAATEAGVGPIVVSGYRTQEKQQSLYDEKINEFLGEGFSREEAIAQAQQWVSVPGTSEHQTGLAVDINGMIWDVYPWLAENSYKYGFILRYPEDKTDITGTQHERWHFRYVGLDAAAEIYSRGLCLEEYLNELNP